jgi:serine/threonine protein kinase
MAEKPSAAVADGPIQKVLFGNFEIVNDPEGRPLALGKGTFGRTYQARHRFLDTIVALKIITERYVADPTVRQRFLIEARAVAKLSHPHIARLYDFGEADGVLHYAMEYCGGGSLADYVSDRGAVGVRQVLEVAQQMLGALKCAHAAGFIHRDLKPSNIMLTGDESPLFTKLIDFGLVQPSLPGATRSVGDDQSADGARFLGTPLFASPEQLREEPMDVRTDLFSLGITLWYLLAGGPPETGSSAAIAASRLSPESYAGRLPANLPPQLRDVLARLLEKDRNKRFASAAEAFSAVNLCATALGFRRARDYSDPKADLRELEETELEQQRPSEAVEPGPVELQKVNAELSSEFTIVARIHEDFTGLNYLATINAAPEQSVILHVLHPLLLQDPAALNRLKVHLAQLKALGRQEVLQPSGIKEFSDYTSIIVEKPNGSDLVSLLRTERTVQLIEAAPLLEMIADTCDALSSAGLPGVHLAPSRIFLEWPQAGESEISNHAKPLSKAHPKLYPRFLAVSEAPELARLNEPEDITSTMTTDMLGDPSRADNMPEHFGTLLYRIVAGRNCLAAASLSSQAYVPIPGLSEHSNQLLSLVIAKQIALTSCGQILREILGAEGIVARIASHPSAGFTARSSGSTITPVDVPPVNRLAPLATPTPPLDKRGAVLRAWQPPTVTPHPSATPAIPKSPLATPPPPAIPQVLPPPVPQVVEARAEPISPPQPTPTAREQIPVPSEPKSSPKKARVKQETKSVDQVAIPTTPKRDGLPPTDTTPSAPSAKEPSTPLPVILPTPPPTRVPKPTIVKEEIKPFDPGALWQNRKLRVAAIGIAALLFFSLSFAVIRKVGHTGAPAKPVAVVPAETQPAKPPPSEAPVKHIIPGRYVGRLSVTNLGRNRRSTPGAPAEFERELSIDPNSPTGYLIEYDGDLNKQVPLAEGRLDAQGAYTARAMFSSATGGAHNDETLSVNSVDNNNLEATFKGRQNSGEQYTLSGALHPWKNDDQARYEKMVAEKSAAAAAAAQRQKEAEQARLAEEARLAEQRQAAAKTVTEQPQKPQQTAASNTTSTHHRQSAGGEGTKSAGTSTHQAATAAAPRTVQAPPPPPAAAAKVAPRPATPKGETQRRQHEFEGSAPGG